MQRKKLGTSLPMLSPEHAAFLQAANPVPAIEEEPRRSLSLAPDRPPENKQLEESSLPLEVPPIVAPVPEPVQTRVTKNERKEKPVPRETSEVTEALVADSFKLPQSLHRRLLRASSERKLERVKPYTKQEIVAVALNDWLSKHGYAST